MNSKSCYLNFRILLGKTLSGERPAFAWKRFLSLTEDVQELQTPKRHAMSHMILDSGFLGNPRCYANWVDESLNKLLKACCRKVSQTTFEEMVLLAMSQLLAGARMSFVFRIFSEVCCCSWFSALSFSLS